MVMYNYGNFFKRNCFTLQHSERECGEQYCPHEEYGMIRIKAWLGWKDNA